MVNKLLNYLLGENDSNLDCMRINAQKYNLFGGFFYEKYCYIGSAVCASFLWLQG